MYIKIVFVFIYNMLGTKTGVLLLATLLLASFPKVVLKQLLEMDLTILVNNSKSSEIANICDYFFFYLWYTDIVGHCYYDLVMNNFTLA